MLPFCGYHMGDYFKHWLDIGKKTDPDKLPKIFYVNWFRKGEDGKFLWPGYGENIRALKWVIERVCGEGKAEETPIGWLPTKDALDLDGLDISDSDLEELLKVDPEEWKKQVPLIREHLAKFGDRLPAGLKDEIDALEKRLGIS
jgi:phosphoenolpyruvate carboxykinase (GTP)